jgi:nucleotide-binding universal stress UspA family protein
MYRILVPVDGSNCAARAADFALALARRVSDAELHLVNVREPGSVDDPFAPLQLQCRRAGVRCEAQVAQGEVATSIVGRCEKLACEQIVMGGRGMTAVDSLVLGSVAMRVVGLAAQPVTVVRAECGPDFSLAKALVAVDGSAHAERAARFAAGLARRLGGCALHLFNAQEPVIEWQTHGLARDAIRAHRAQLAEQAGAGARALLERAGLAFQFEWRFGDPAQAIVDAARDAGCDQIVMGTRGAGPIENLMLGSVAYRLLHIANVPVTLVK